MPKDLTKRTAFHFTPVDRTALDPDSGAWNDIGLWYRLYTDRELFDWQKYFYHRVSSTGKPIKDKLCVSAIRTGKTFGLGKWYAHYGMFHPNRLILNTSISTEQAKLVFYDLRDFFSSDRLKHWVQDIRLAPFPVIELANNTVYHFRPLGHDGSLLRGFEYDVIGIDEAAYVTRKEAIDAVRGRLLGFNNKVGAPRDGHFWQVSSPKGKGGHLYDRWKLGDPRFYGSDPDKYLSLRVRITENPLLDEDTLRSVMAGYSDKMIQQEMYGEFVDNDGAEWDVEQISYCCSEVHKEVEDLLQKIAQWKSRLNKKTATIRESMGIASDLDYYELEPVGGRQYIASWDLGKKATKAGRNATVGMVWDVTEIPWKMVAFRYETGTSYLAAKALIEAWHMKYSSRGTECHTIIDASGKGDVLNELIEAENRFSVDGIVYSNQLKPNLITAGKLAIERDMVRFPPIRRMIDQLAGYSVFDKDIAQDIVMSFCQAMFKARELTGLSISRGVNVGATPTVYRRQNIGMAGTQRYAERRRAAFHQRTGRTY